MRSSIGHHLRVTFLVLALVTVTGCGVAAEQTPGEVGEAWAIAVLEDDLPTVARLSDTLEPLTSSDLAVIRESLIGHSDPVDVRSIGLFASTSEPEWVTYSVESMECSPSVGSGVLNELGFAFGVSKISGRWRVPVDLSGGFDSP